MDLILWRHAEAEIIQAGQDDLERALTTKGERQAHRMAKWLNARLAESTRILVSPAVRTQQTAEALDRKFKTVASVAPERSVDDLLVAAGWPGGRVPVLVVGHQPTLGLTAARLLAGADQPWAMKKAAVWWLRLREREGEAQITVHAAQTVDAL
jgi:phosphohistidine phosphatase